MGPVLSSWGTEREAAGVALQEEGEIGTPSSFKALQQVWAHKMSSQQSAGLVSTQELPDASRTGMHH